MANASPNQMEFTAEPIPFFIKSIIAGLCMLIYVPAPAQLTDLLKYVISNFRFADGTTASYVGTEEALKQPLIGVTGSIWAQILLPRFFDSALLSLIIGLAVGLAQAYFVYQLLKVIFPNIVTNHGSRLNFAASQEEYLAWLLVILGAGVIPSLFLLILPFGLLLGVLMSLVSLVFTFVLRGIALSLYCKWFASKVQGGSRIPSFQADPFTYVAMMMGFLLFCCLIVTIPWAVIWFTKWLASRTSLPARPDTTATNFAF